MAAPSSSLDLIVWFLSSCALLLPFLQMPKVMWLGRPMGGGSVFASCLQEAPRQWSPPCLSPFPLPFWWPRALGGGEAQCSGHRPCAGLDCRPSDPSLSLFSSAFPRLACQLPSGCLQPTRGGQGRSQDISPSPLAPRLGAVGRSLAAGASPLRLWLPADGLCL